MTTLGEALVTLLEAHGVDTVFGIPGVHTVELYRGLAGSKIRHVTPRHEQGAAFMADGYARASGKPGVAFVITGPGLTNAITAMAQARADSVPMLVISGVNASPTLGKGFGYLHELPDQRGMMEKVALSSTRIVEPAELSDALAEAFALFASARPGPVHIEIPTDVMVKPAGELSPAPRNATPPVPDEAAVNEATRRAAAAKRSLILVGGGAKHAEASLRALAEKLDAPVIQTANGRGLMHGHPLTVPASPSLKAVRALMAEADFVIAAGTEFGPTDYDMYGDGGFVPPANLVRIDIDPAQLARRPAAVSIQADCEVALDAILASLDGIGEQAPPLRRTARDTSSPLRGGEDGSQAGRPSSPPGAGGEVAPRSGDGEGGGVALPEPLSGAARAEKTRAVAWAEIGPAMQAQVKVVEAVRDTLSGAIVVGDSTQPVYAANLFYEHDRPGGWFNAATGFGALGYGPPAAIGAALAMPDAPVVCLTGDGGFQFTLPELGAASDAGANVIFVVWNNRGYREIETSMREVGVEPVGVSPAPPDFLKLAEAYGIGAERARAENLPEALMRAHAAQKPRIIEISVE